MKEIEKYLLFSIINEISDPYDLKTYDDEVDECLMNMYFFMLSSDMSEERREELWKEFDESYQKLNSEQQEKVKQDYIDIIKAQDENNEKVKQDYIDIIKAQNENNEKVKKKGMNKYE